MFGPKTYRDFEKAITRLFKKKAGLFLGWFETSPAENFIRVAMSDRRTNEEYVLTIQRVNGTNPVEHHNLLDAKIVILHNALQEIGELAWDVRNPEQARVRVQQISDIASIIDE